jgi:tetratricopeptide (TPR) repeat protein
MFPNPGSFMSVLSAFAAPVVVFRKRPVLATFATVVLVGLSGVLSALLWWKIHFQRGESAAAADRFPEAIREFRKCLAVRPRHTPTLLHLADLHRLSGQFDEASKILSTIVEHEGEMIEDVQVEYLLIRAATGEFDVVEPALWQVVTDDRPMKRTVLETLATVYIREMNYSTANMSLQYALQNEIESPRLLEAMAFVQSALENHDRGIELYRKAIELAPDRLSAKIRLGNLYQKAGRLEDAATTFEAIRHLDPSNPDLLSGYAMALNFRGAPVAERRAAFQAAIAVNPKQFVANLELARLEIEDGHPEAAEQVIRGCLAYFPNEAEIRFLLVEAIRRQSGRSDDLRIETERFNQSRSDAERFFSLSRTELIRQPENPDLMCEIAEILMRTGERDVAVRWLRKATAIKVTHVKANALLADYFESIRQPELAAKHAKYVPNRK